MPSDSELRDRFREGTQPRGEIDVDAVLRRARARRRPKLALAGAGSVLAIAAIAVPAVFLTAHPGTGSTEDAAILAGEPVDQAPPSADGAGETTIADRAPADLLNLCGAAVSEAVPAANGLVISVAPVAATADERDIPLTVRLTNTGDERVTGTTGSRPSVTFAGGGITLWHTHGVQDLAARAIDLAPGESVDYAASFDPLVCGIEDDKAGTFRSALPAAGPGDYTLSAAIEVVGEDGEVELVTGPAVGITLG